MIYELDTALATHFINTLRDETINALEFRNTIKKLTLLLADRLFDSSDLHMESIVTWQGAKPYERLVESDLVIVTVLRAGLPMLESMIEYFPEAKAGFLAIKRDETTHKSKLYYDRLPDCRGKHVILVDPMVATGGSLIDGLDILRERRASKVSSLNIIAAPEGLQRVSEAYPELDIFVAQIDEQLNSDKYILPGLGDAGDRSYSVVD